MEKPEALSPIISNNAYRDGRATLCSYVDQARIWEPGDEGIDTEHNFRDTLHVEVDGVAQRDLEIAPLTILISVNDENGNPLGSHGGSIRVCFSVADLVDGLHLGSISFQSTSGKEYAYEWAFRVVHTADTVNAQLPAALQAP